VLTAALVDAVVLLADPAVAGPVLPPAASGRHRASACPGSFTHVSANRDRQRQQRSFSELEDVKREDSKRRLSRDHRRRAHRERTATQRFH
jgi:hypothetical protein